MLVMLLLKNRESKALGGYLKVLCCISAYLFAPPPFFLCVFLTEVPWRVKMIDDILPYTPTCAPYSLCQSSEKRCCPPLGLLLSQVLLSTFSKERTSVSQTREGSQQQCTLAVGFRRREGTELFHMDILTSWACGSRRWISLYMCC